MGNSAGKIEELELSRLDVEATPSCPLDKGMLQSEWRSFLVRALQTRCDASHHRSLVQGKHILRKLGGGDRRSSSSGNSSGSSVSASSLRKLKTKRQWQILCKHQRSIAKRFQQDADVALKVSICSRSSSEAPPDARSKMALLEEAAALYHASRAIHELVTKPSSDTDHLHASLKMAERDLKTDPQSRRRSERPAPAEPALRDLFSVFLVSTPRTSTSGRIGGVAWTPSSLSPSHTRLPHFAEANGSAAEHPREAAAALRLPEVGALSLRRVHRCRAGRPEARRRRV